MNRHDEIKNAYRSLGREATFYDGMITCSTLPGRVVCELVWNMGKEKNTCYLEKTLDRIPEGFVGKLLEVPVGTGVLTIPIYKALPQADITCLATAQKRAKAAGLTNVRFQQGDVGRCPSETVCSTWCCPSTVSMPFPTRRRRAGIAARRDFLRLLLCERPESPYRLVCGKAIHPQRIFYSALRDGGQSAQTAD